MLDVDNAAKLSSTTREVIRKSEPFKTVYTPSGGSHLYYKVSTRDRFGTVLGVETSTQRLGGTYRDHERSLDILVPGNSVIVPPTQDYVEHLLDDGAGDNLLPEMFLKLCRVGSNAFDEGDWL